MNEVKWYEKGDIGDRIRDLLDFWDPATSIREMQKLGLTDEEILDVILKEEEYA
jgi:hypothetical protein